MMKRNERGAAATELVLVLPVLVFVVWTAIFAGWVGVARALLDHGVQAGARAAAIPTSPDLRSYPNDAAIAQAVKDATPLITPGSVRVATPSAARNAPVEVSADYSVPIPWPIAAMLHLFDDPRTTVTITARAEARRE
jgi:Flp pilus assembly protein TadG